MLEIKDWHSPDIKNVWNWNPKSPEEIYYLLEISIGPKKKESSNLFQFIVASPQGLLNKLDEPTWGRSYLIVLFENYSFSTIENIVKNLVKDASNKFKNDKNEKRYRWLNRTFLWEYEDLNK